MNKLRRWLIRSLWILGVASILLVLLVLDFLRFGGVFTDLPATTAASCRSISLPGSAEDIQLDREQGLAYLSLLDRRALVTGEGSDGDIGVLNLSDPASGAVSALAEVPTGFRPHGMSLYRMQEGGHRLFVISHPPDDAHVIEIFEQLADGGPFVRVDSVRDPLFQSPNAIVATGPEQFYVINDSGAENALDRLRETLFRAGLSTLVFFDGEVARVAAEGLKSGVGLAISPDGRTIHVAETLGKRLARFERDPQTNNLGPARYIPMPGSPDNIQVDPAGRLWVAVHPKLLDLVRHFGNPLHPAPTLILRGGDSWTIAHLNTGEVLSAGSVGVAHAGMLWVGSITEPKVLQCPLQGDAS